MKCPNCGSQDFYSLNLENDQNYLEGGGGEVRISGFKLHAYLCKKCGRIELYSTEGLSGIKAQEQKRIEEEAAKEAKEKRKSFLLKEVERLQAIIEDENQTVRAVKQAEEEIEKARKELKELGYSFDFVRGNY